MMHHVDWLATFVRLGGGQADIIDHGYDSIDQWDHIASVRVSGVVKPVGPPRPCEATTRLTERRKRGKSPSLTFPDSSCPPALS